MESYDYWWETTHVIWSISSDAAHETVTWSDQVLLVVYLSDWSAEDESQLFDSFSSLSSLSDKFRSVIDVAVIFDLLS